MYIKKKVNISSSDFARLTLHLVYMKRFAKFTIYLGIASIIQLIISNFQESPNDILVKVSIVGIMISTGIPTLTWMGSKMNYKNNIDTLTDVTYEFSDQGLRLIGKDFSSSDKWKDIHSINISKKWIVIWRNSQVANPVPADVFDPEEISQLKTSFQKSKVLIT